MRFSTSDPSLFSGRILSVKTYNGPGLGDWEPDGYELHFNFVVDGGEPVFPSDSSGWRASFIGWGVDAGSLFVPSSTAISLDSTDEISQDSLDYTKYNVLTYSDAMFLWPNLSNYLYRGCVCMKITLVADTTAYHPEITEPEVPL